VCAGGEETLLTCRGAGLVVERGKERGAMLLCVVGRGGWVVKERERRGAIVGAHRLGWGRIGLWVDVHTRCGRLSPPPTQQEQARCGTYVSAGEKAGGRYAARGGAGVSIVTVAVLLAQHATCGL